MKTLASILFALSTLTSFVYGQDRWKQTPGGPIDGSVYGLTVDSLQRIYVTTGGAGVFQSTDHGATWHGFSRGLRILPVRWIESSTIEKKGTDAVAYVYALSHRKEVMRRVVNTVSSDAQWEYLDSIIGGSPTVGVNQLMTNSKGYLFLATEDFGVLRSRDDGEHFDQPLDLKAPKPDSFVICMAIDRRTQDLYAVSDNGSRNHLVAHISRSTDDGATWQALPTTPPEPSLITKMVIADDGSICCGYQVRFGIDTMVVRSTDLGQSWHSVLNTPPVAEANIVSMIHAVKGGDLYLNMHGPTWRSSDNGATWTLQSPIKRGDEFFDLVADSLGYLYQCATPDGIYRSDDSGKTWHNLDRTLAVQHLDGGMAINTKGHVFCTSNFSIFRTTDEGNSWYTLPNELEEANFPLIVCDKEDYVYYSHYLGMYRSHDNGETFDQIIKYDSVFYGSNQVFYIGVSPKNELWASCLHDVNGEGSDSWLVRSKDHGTTWTHVNTSGFVGIPSNLPVYCLAFSAGSDPQVDDTIYAAGNTNNIYRSINDGLNWDVINTEGNSMKQLLCHPDGSVFRFQSGPAGNTGEPGDTNLVLTGGVYRSVNGGKDWVRVFPTAAQHFVDSIDYLNISVVPMVLDRLGRIMIATQDSGFWISKNADFTEWENVSEGFVAPDFYRNKPLNASQVVQDYRTGVFYADSRGASVFKTMPDLAIWPAAVPMSPISASISEPVNYPNPFANSTQISFDIPNSGYVKISVFDVMGRPMKVLFDGFMTAGKHNISYDVSKLISNGKYLVVLQSGGEQTSHWMTVTK